MRRDETDTGAAAADVAEGKLAKLRIRLDWTPNTNHSGLYVAQHNGFYRKAGLEVEILPPSQDYAKAETPARALVNGNCDLCIAPSESVISCHTSDTGAGKPRPKCVAAVLQDDCSAIATRKGADIKSLKDIGGKVYASYAGRFEPAIVREAVKLSGGNGDEVKFVEPPKLNCFEEVMAGRADATWIFTAWEGVDARRRGIEYESFSLSEVGVPYGYSPCILASPEMYTEKQAELRSFLGATARGYVESALNPERAAVALFKIAGDDAGLKSMGMDAVVDSARELKDHFLKELKDKGIRQWGTMEGARWQRFADFLFANDCIKDRDGKVLAKDAVDVGAMWTNEFLLPESLK